MHLPRRFAVVLSLFAASVAAQDFGPFPAELPPAEAGLAYDYTLLPGFEEALSGLDGVTITSTVSGDVPPGITVSAGGRVSGVPTRIGNYAFQLALRFAIADGGQGFAIRLIFAITLAVRGSATGGLTIDGGGLSFNFTQGSAAAQTRTIRITNRGAQARSVSVSTASIPAGWLSASGGGSVAAFSSATVSVTANPATLLPGVFSGSVEIAASGGGNERFTLPAVAAVTAAGPGLVVSQTGLTFEVQQGSPANLSQIFQVSGTNATALQFTAAATTITGGSWLRLTPANGTASATASAAVTASISAGQLQAGQYHGQIEVSAGNANNSPRTVNAVLNVLAAGLPVAPLVAPTAIVMVQRPGVAIPAQPIAVTNVSNTAVSLAVAVTFDGTAAGWFAARAGAATIASGQSAEVVVTRQTAVRLAPGVYTGEVALRLGTVQRRVAIVLIVPAAPGNTAATQTVSEAGAVPLEGCTPTRLVPVFTTLGNSFAVVAAWPSALEMRVVDDCGDPMLAGAVTVSFSNGDPPLVLGASGEGRWSATWAPKAGAQNVVLTADARTTAAPLLAGNAQIGGTAAANASTPVIASSGIVNAATPLAGVPLSPGTYVAIFGRAMATGLTVAEGVPFPTDLAGTQVILAGRRLPLQFAADGQINALVPFDVPLNVPQLMVVRRGNVLSTPEPVVLAQAQPAVFTKNQSGSGEGIVVGARADGSQFLISPTAPAAAGEVLIIYCAGLGAVNPAVPAGTAAPSSPLATVTNPVTVTVGGRQANVLFAGMTPGLAGLYQVNAVVPEGVTPGTAVELVLTAAGRSSSPVTVAIR